MQIFFGLPALILRYPGFSTLSDAKGEKARSGAVGRDTELQAGRSRVRFPMMSLKFFINIILPATLWPWDRLSV